MELTFNKVGNTYIAEYQATTHFNLHIEGGGRVAILKRTAGTKGEIIATIPADVVDTDIAVNFPATYEIRCETMPTMAEITE